MKTKSHSTNKLPSRFATILASWVVPVVCAVIAGGCLAVMAKIPLAASFTHLTLMQQAAVVLFWVCVILFLLSLGQAIRRVVRSRTRQPATAPDPGVALARSVMLAGRTTVAVGWMQLLLLPGIIYLIWLENPKISRPEFIMLSSVNAVFAVTIGTVLVLSGRILKNPVTGSDTTRIKAIILRIIWVIIGSGIISLLLGGSGISLVFIFLLVELLQCLRVARRYERSLGSPPSGPSSRD